MEEEQKGGQKQNDARCLVKVFMSNRVVHMNVYEEDFIKLIQRGINTWDTAPPEIKSLCDYIATGDELQDYQAQHSGATGTGE